MSPEDTYTPTYEWTLESHTADQFLLDLSELDDSTLTLSPYSVQGDADYIIQGE